MGNLALGPQCCCDGPGVTRVYHHNVFLPGFTGFGTNSATYRIVNPADDLPDPCWSVGNPYPFQYTGGFAPNHIMGYDYVENRLIISNQSGLGAVHEILFNECVNGVSARQELISSAEAAAIQVEATSVGAQNVRIYWNCHSIGRLYGYSQYNIGSEYYFKAFSVLEDGTDYTEHFDLDLDEEVDAVFRGVMNVMDGVIYSTHATEGVAVKIRVNGSLVDTVDGTFELINQELGWAVAKIGSQRLICTGSLISDFPYSGLFINDGGDLGASNNVALAVLETTTTGLETVVYTARCVSWDAKAKAVVVVWGPGYVESNPFSTGWTPEYPSGFTTYIYKPLIAGNIIGQEGVALYANLYSGFGYNYGRLSPNAADQWAVAISGRMPRTLEVIDGVIQPPPPPEPDPPTCDPIEDCGEQTNSFDFTRFENCDNPTTEPSVGDVIEHHLKENLNGSYSMTTVAETADTTCIAAAAFAGEYLYHIALGYEPEPRYSDPGILIQQNEYIDSPDLRKEVYVYAIYLMVRCADGIVSITDVYLATQTFAGFDGTTWPNPDGTALSNGCEYYSPPAITGGVIAGECMTGRMSARFEYDLCGATGEFDVGGNFGPQE